MVEEREVIEWPKHRRRDWIQRMEDELDAAYERADNRWLVEVMRVLPGLLPGGA